MRLFFLSLLVLVFSSSLAVGQVSVKVDGSDPMPAEDLKSIVIDDLGNMTITSQNGNYQLTKNTTPGNVSINTFRIDGALSANIENPGDVVAVSWGTSNAESCEASSTVIQGDAIDVPGWSTTTSIGTSGPLNVQFDDIGEFRLTLTCRDVNNNTDTATVTAKVGAVILDFTMTTDPAEPQSGDSVSVSLEWTAANAAECYGSWTASPTTDVTAQGTFSEVVTANPPSIDYTIRCFNLIDEVERTVTVDVTDPPPSCNVTLTSRVLRSWTTSFGTQFPGPNFTRVGFASIPTFGYAAYGFETDNVDDDGFVATFQANGTSGQRIISMSQIPGCFDVEPECLARGRDTTIEWDTTGTSSTACQLQKGKTYYWNVTFTNGFDGSSNTCPGDCYAGLVVNNPDFGN